MKTKASISFKSDCFIISFSAADFIEVKDELVHNLHEHGNNFILNNINYLKKKL